MGNFDSLKLIKYSVLATHDSLSPEVYDVSLSLPGYCNDNEIGGPNRLICGLFAFGRRIWPEMKQTRAEILLTRAVIKNTNVEDSRCSKSIVTMTSVGLSWSAVLTPSVDTTNVHLQ